MGAVIEIAIHHQIGVRPSTIPHTRLVIHAMLRSLVTSGGRVTAATARGSNWGSTTLGGGSARATVVAFAIRESGFGGSGGFN